MPSSAFVGPVVRSSDGSLARYSVLLIRRRAMAHRVPTPRAMIATAAIVVSRPPLNASIVGHPRGGRAVARQVRHSKIRRSAIESCEVEGFGELNLRSSVFPGPHPAILVCSQAINR